MKKIFIALVVMVLVMPPVFADLTNRYVVKNNAGAAIPYDTLAKAAADIQTAINYAYAGETVLVAAATYDAGGTNLFSLTNRIYISKAITVKSIDNNPITTVIKGAWDPVITNGPAAVRCVYMVTNSLLIGFTLTNGATATSGDYRSECGGGVCSAATTTYISNCVISGNTAYGDGPNGVGGGGASFGTYFNCTFTGNRVGSGRCLGGGAYAATLSNCVISGNIATEVATGNGGGVARGTLYGCLVSNNTAASGGGLFGWSPALPCIAYNCTIVTNKALTSHGGGAGGQSGVGICTILSNCTVAFNAAGGIGGGADLSILHSCLVVSNYSAVAGGGTSRSTLTNCIVAYNVGGGSRYDVKVRNSLFYGNNLSAIYVRNGDIVENCTFVGNDIGISLDQAATVAVVNCISYSNTVNWTTNSTVGTLVAFTNSCTYPENPGWDASNTTNNPLFVDFGSGYGTNHVAGNYRLLATSPCINTGTNQDWMTNAVDLDGNNRILFGTVDMGAYEANSVAQHLWTTGGDIESSPAIGTNGMIYVGSWDGKFYAFNPDGTTQRVWTIGATIVCSPAIGTNGTIYVGANNSRFYAFNQDGTTQHVWTAGDMFYFSSPAIGADGTIYAGSRDNNLYAFNPDGTTQHVWKTGNDIDYSSPAIDTNGIIYVGSADSNLYAFAPNGTTAMIWKTGGAIKSSPAIGTDGTIYVGSEDFKLYAFNPNGTTQKVWNTGARIQPAPAIAPDGTIYVGSDDNKVYAFHPNGATNHVWTTGGDAYSGPAIRSDGTIYAGSANGKLYAFNSDGTTNRVWTTGGFMFSSPAIGTNGIVYVGSADNNLYAFDGTGGSLATNSPWPKHRQNLRNTGRRDIDAVAPLPVLSVSPMCFTNAITQGENCPSDTFQLWNSGGGTLNFTLITNAAWLAVSPASGSSTGEHDMVIINYQPTALTAGGYTGQVIVASTVSTSTISVYLTVTGQSPSITTHPQSLIINPGQSAMFSLTVTGTAPLIYQWQKNTTNISGATSTNYTITSVAETNEGNYRCIVTNMAGSVTSSVASLTINDPPVVTVNPQSTTNNPGSSIAFSLAATGTAPLIYQWQKDGANIPGATATNYTIASVAETNAGNYRCVVTNMAGSATSSDAPSSAS